MPAVDERTDRPWTLKGTNFGIGRHVFALYGS